MKLQSLYRESNSNGLGSQDDSMKPIIMHVNMLQIVISITEGQLDEQVAVTN